MTVSDGGKSHDEHFAATTRRVNVNFSGEAWEALRYLADVRDSTISDVLRRSLATLKWAHDVQREGAHFIREDANGKRTEVIFL